jgi:peptide/nickel transport system substrate-binding protein
MKRSLLLIILAIVVISSMLVACKETAPATTTTAVPTTAIKTTTATTAPATIAGVPATSVAAATATTVKVVPTGTLRIAEQDFAYESFDQNFWTTFWGWAMCDPLLTYDNNANIIGCVADSYSLSADSLTWTFKIHKGILFSNGDPLTAADVKFSVDRFSSNTSTNPWAPYLRANFKSDAVVDDYTYTYTCNTPEPPLSVPFSNVLIIPKNYIEKNGVDYFRANPIGSGPYKLVKLVSRTTCTLEARTDYWGQVASWKTIIDYMVPEESTRVAMLKSGDVDIINTITPDRLVELKKLGFGLQEVGLDILGNISFPGTWETTSPTSDIKVRQALSYAINRQEMCDTFYKGLAQPGSRWQMQIGAYGWDPTWVPDPYDVTQAKALLAAAGYPDKFKDPVIKIYAQGYHMDMMNMLVGYWNKVGVQTKIITVDSIKFAGLFFASARAPTGDNIGAIIPWVYAGPYNSMYHAANMYTSTGVHATGNDPAADALYQKAKLDTDPVQARKDYTAFIQYGYNMWVNVGIYQMPSYAAVGPNVGKITGPIALGIWACANTIQHAK